MCKGEGKVGTDSLAEPTGSMDMLPCQCVIAPLMYVFREELPVRVPK